jgi:hypothetical protein
MRLIVKQRFVEGMQYTGYNLDELEKWIDGPHDIMGRRGPASIRFYTDGDMTEAFVGDWIIKGGDGCHAVDGRSFDTFFEVASP